MFAEFNYDNFPIINVRLNNIVNEEDFESFLKVWLNLYLQKQDFIFLFDTTNITYAPIFYSIKMCCFIKKLKSDFNYHYLKKSFMLVNNPFINSMLSLIFKLQKPVAPIYIFENKNDVKYLLDNKSTILDDDFLINLSNFTYISPGNSLIPFL